MVTEDSPMTIDVVTEGGSRDTPIRAILVDPLAVFKTTRYTKLESQIISGDINNPNVLLKWSLVSSAQPDINNYLPFGFEFFSSILFKANLPGVNDAISVRFQTSKDNVTWTDLDHIDDTAEGGLVWNPNVVINTSTTSLITTNDGSTTVYYRLIAYKTATNNVTISDVDFFAEQMLYGHVSLVKII